MNSKKNTVLLAVLSNYIAKRDNSRAKIGLLINSITSFNFKRKTKLIQREFNRYSKYENILNTIQVYYAKEVSETINNSHQNKQKDDSNS
jgi:hypothetical protein